MSEEKSYAYLTPTDKYIIALIQYNVLLKNYIDHKIGHNKYKKMRHECIRELGKWVKEGWLETGNDTVILGDIDNER